MSDLRKLAMGNWKFNGISDFAFPIIDISGFQGVYMLERELVIFENFQKFFRSFYFCQFCLINM